MASLVKRILLVFLSLTICWLLMDIFLVGSGYKNKVFIWSWAMGLDYDYVSDKDLIYYFNPNKISDRSDFFNTDKNNILKIAFVGDSVAFGHELAKDQKLSYLFAKRMAEQYKDNQIEGINLGVPGYGLDQEYFLIKERLLKDKTYSSIIWNINVNDIWDTNFSCLYKKDRKNNFVKVPASFNTVYLFGKLVSIDPKVFKKDPVLNLFVNNISKIFTAKTGEERYTFGCTNNDYVWMPQKSIVYEKLNYYLDDLKKAAEAKGVKLVVTLVPYQLYFDKNVKTSDITSEYFKIKEICSNKQITFLNLNETILSELDLDLYLKRTGKNLDPNKVLATNTENLSEKYFLGGKRDISPFGWHHPNEIMSELMSKALFDIIQNNEK